MIGFFSVFGVTSLIGWLYWRERRRQQRILDEAERFTELDADFDAHGGYDDACDYDEFNDSGGNDSGGYSTSSERRDE